MDVIEEMIGKYIITYVRENAKEEMEFFCQFIDKGLAERLDTLVNNEFDRITYTQAIEILKKRTKNLSFQ